MVLSIITVVYNDSKGLSSTINSLTKQKNKNFEHVVIDGNSTDNTLVVIRDNSEKIGFFVSEPDNGIYDAMNKGVENSSGDFVSFLNAGDVALSNYTETCIDFFTRNPALEYCYSSIIMTSNMGESVYHPKRLSESKDILQKMPFPHPGLFVRKNIFNKVGFFNIRKKITADHEWIVRMILCGIKGKVVDTNQPIVNFQLDGVSLSFATIVEMKDTAVQFGRSKILANCKMIRGFFVVIFYKYLK